MGHTQSFRSLFAAALGTGILLSLACTADDETVRTSAGVLEGSKSDMAVAFKGIPYAAAPVGHLRWHEPQPVEAGARMREALSFFPDCMQHPIDTDAAPLGTEPAEDCLAVNVWRPPGVRDGADLPVLIWIHGGGYVNGGSSTAIYDGSAFAHQGLVFVSFNYRLGRFGFFAHPALSAANEGRLGNYGYFDQLEALRWVQKNIRAFGGNPDQVTLMGESAGGDSVLHWMTSPAARGLFQRAIVLSGGGRAALLGEYRVRSGTLSEPSAELAGIAFGAGAGVFGDGADALTALRELPAETIVGDLDMESLLEAGAMGGAPITPTYFGAPLLDDEMISASPGEVLCRGTAAPIALMIGTTSQDLPLSFPRSKDELFDAFGSWADAARVIYDPDGTRELGELTLMVGADRAMHEPARFAARQMSAAGNRVWMYRFSYVAESIQNESPGASHASELPYAFGTLDARYGANVTERDREVSRAFHSYIVSFAKRGVPRADELPEWPELDPESPELMDFARSGSATPGADAWRNRLDAVERGTTQPCPEQ